MLCQGLQICQGARHTTLYLFTKACAELAVGVDWTCSQLAAIGSSTVSLQLVSLKNFCMCTSLPPLDMSHKAPKALQTELFKHEVCKRDGFLQA